jgi:uncharacterized Fe-S cluster-containing radical SAM superfamily protein
MAAVLPSAPRVPFADLRSLWFQVTGTLCNLACRHCFNASGPRNPWLGMLDAAVVHRSLREAEALGVREVYFTGGEPFLHPALPDLLVAALRIAPVTALTNGTLIGNAMAERLARIAGGTRYSLELRVSLDAPTAEANDAVRGRGSFAKALTAIRALAARGLPPIVTATEIVAGSEPGALYARLRALLLEAGVERPRIKILPVLPLGRCAGRGEARPVTADDLDGFDVARLPSRGWGRARSATASARRRSRTRRAEPASRRGWRARTCDRAAARALRRRLQQRAGPGGRAGGRAPPRRRGALLPRRSRRLRSASRPGLSAPRRGRRQMRPGQL